MRLRDEVLRQGRYFNGGANWQRDGWLAPQSNRLIRAWLPGSFMDQRWGEVRKQSKKTIQSLQMSPRMANLRQGNVLISLPYSPSWGFPYSSVGKESACNAGDLGLIPGLGRSPGEGNGNPLQYSCLENLMERGAWRATVHGVARVEHDLATNPPPPPTVLHRWAAQVLSLRQDIMYVFNNKKGWKSQ